MKNNQIYNWETHQFQSQSEEVVDRWYIRFGRAIGNYITSINNNFVENPIVLSFGPDNLSDLEEIGETAK